MMNKTLSAALLSTTIFASGASQEAQAGRYDGIAEVFSSITKTVGRACSKQEKTCEDIIHDLWEDDQDNEQSPSQSNTKPIEPEGGAADGFQGLDFDDKAPTPPPQNPKPIVPEGGAADGFQGLDF